MSRDSRNTDRAALFFALGAVLLCAPMVAGCGGDSASDCEVFGDAVCDVACECAAGDECVFTAGAVTLTFSDRADCLGFFSPSLACRDGGDPEFDYAGCAEDVDQATCEESDEVGTAVLPECAAM